MPAVPPRILIVEDDPGFRQMLEECLKPSGYRVLTAWDGEAGLAVALDEQPDLVVLDIGLPILDGVAVCIRLRERQFEAPILMLTGKGMVKDRVIGLDAGADDYLAKPFAIEEFLARVNALLRRRRRATTSPALLQLGDIHIDFGRKTAVRAGQPLSLTKTEYALLKLLASNEGRPVSRETMLDRVWGYTRLPATRTIDTHIWRLRKKIGDDGDSPRWIKPVHGSGYCLSLPVDLPSSIVPPRLLHLIVACAENRVIGRGGKLPWRIPEDLKFFHDETAGKICVLGRICYETWPQVHSDGRRPIVITRNRALMQPGVHLAASLDEALAIAETLPGEICICGGQRIYEETLALHRPMRLHLTLIHADVPGDTFFPEWRHLAWREIARRESADANYRYTFFTLDR